MLQDFAADQRKVRVLSNAWTFLRDDANYDNTREMMKSIFNIAEVVFGVRFNAGVIMTDSMSRMNVMYDFPRTRCNFWYVPGVFLAIVIFLVGHLDTLQAQQRVPHDSGSVHAAPRNHQFRIRNFAR